MLPNKSLPILRRKALQLIESVSSIHASPHRVQMMNFATAQPDRVKHRHRKDVSRNSQHGTASAPSQHTIGQLPTNGENIRLLYDNHDMHFHIQEGLDQISSASMASVRGVTTQAHYEQLMKNVVSDLKNVLECQETMLPVVDLPIEFESDAAIANALDIKKPSLFKTLAEHSGQFIFPSDVARQSLTHPVIDSNRMNIYDNALLLTVQKLHTIMVTPLLERKDLKLTALHEVAYELIFTILTKSSVSLARATPTAYLAAMAKLGVRHTPKTFLLYLQSTLKAGQFSPCVGAVEVMMGFQSAAAQELLQFLPNTDSSLFEDKKAIFDLALSGLNQSGVKATKFVPMVYKAMVSKSIPLDQFTLQTFLTGLVNEGALTLAQSLMNAAEGNGLILPPSNVCQIFTSLNRNSDDIFASLAQSVPPKLADLVNTNDRSDLDSPYDFPTCSFIPYKNLSVTQQRFFSANATQVHTLISLTKFVQFILGYIERNHVQVTTHASTDLISFLCKAGMHSEALSMFAAMVRQHTDNIDPFSMVLLNQGDESSTSTPLDRLNNSQLLAQALTDSLDSLTSYVSKKVFPNRKQLREYVLAMTNDGTETSSNEEIAPVLARLEGIFAELEAHPSLDVEETLYAQIIVLLNAEDLRTSSRRRMHILDELMKKAGDKVTNRHASHAYMLAKCLNQTLTKYAPAAVKDAVGIPSEDPRLDMSALANRPNSSSVTGAIDVLNSLPVRSLNIFNFDKIQFGSPDLVTLRTVLNSGKQGFRFEVLSLVEMSLVFTRLHHLLKSNNGTELTIQDPVILNMVNKFISKYNLNIDAKSLTLTPSAKLRALATDLGYDVDVLPYTNVLFSPALQMHMIRYNAQVISQAMGIHITPTYQHLPAHTSDTSVCSSMIMTALTHTHNLPEPTLINRELFYSFKRTVFANISTANPAMFRVTSPAISLSNLIGDKSFSPVFSLSLDDPTSPSSALSIMSGHNIAGRNALALSSAETVNAAIENFNDKPYFSSFGNIDFAEHMMEEVKIPTSHIDYYRMVESVGHTGAFKHFTLRSHNDNLTPYVSAELAQGSAVHAISAAHRSLSIEMSVRLMKEWVNVFKARNIELNTASTHFITNLCAIKHDDVDVVFDCYVDSPVVLEAAKQSVNNDVNVLFKDPNASETMINDGLVSFFVNYLQGNPSHKELSTMARVSDINHKLMSIGETMSIINHMDISPKDLIVPPANTDHAVDHLAALVHAVDPNTSQYLSKSVKDNLEKMYELSTSKIIAPTSKSAANVSAEFTIAAKVALASRLSQDVFAHHKTMKVLPLTRLHAIMTLTHITQMAAPISKKSEGVYLTHTPTATFPSVNPVMFNHVNLAPFLLKSIGLDMGNFALKHCKIFATKGGRNREFTMTVNSLITAYSAATRGDLNIKLFREVMFRNASHSVVTLRRLQNGGEYQVNEVPTVMMLNELSMELLIRSVRHLPREEVLSTLIDIFAYMSVLRKKSIRITHYNDAINALAAHGFFTEAVDLFMTVLNPEYMTNLVTNLGNTAATTAAAHRKPFSSSRVFGVDGEGQMKRLSDPIYLSTKKESILDAEPEYLQESNYLATVIALAKTTARNDSGLALKDCSPVTPGSIPGSFPAIDKEVPLRDVFNSKSAMDHQAYSRRQENSYVASPFIMAFLRVVQPVSDSKNANEARVVPAPTHNTYKCMIQACSIGEAAYPELATQIMTALCFHAPPEMPEDDFPLRRDKDLSPQFKQLLDKFDSNEQAYSTLLRLSMINRSMIQTMSNFNVPPPVFNGHLFMNQVDACFRGITTGPYTAPRNDAVAKELGIKLGQSGKTVPNTLANPSNVFVIPFINFRPSEGILHEFYKTFVHRNCPAAVVFPAIAQDQSNAIFAEIFKAGQQSDLSALAEKSSNLFDIHQDIVKNAESQGSDKSLNDNYVETYGIMSQYSRFFIEFRKFINFQPILTEFRSRPSIFDRIQANLVVNKFLKKD